MNDDTRALIGAGIRSVAVNFPVLSTLVQGWSEYEGNLFQNRVEEFFTQIGARLDSLESLQTANLGRLLSVEAQIALLEETVSATVREPQVGKRETFVNFYLAAISGQLGAEPDRVRSLLQTLEALTPSDIEFLKTFNNRSGICTGDQISGTTSLDQWEQVGGDPNADAVWSVRLDPVIQKATKLETRGLIIETRRPTAFQHSGDSGSWYNAFRRKAWRITDTGCQLLQAIATRL